MHFADLHNQINIIRADAASAIDRLHGYTDDGEVRAIGNSVKAKIDRLALDAQTFASNPGTLPATGLPVPQVYGPATAPPTGRPDVGSQAPTDAVHQQIQLKALELLTRVL